MTSKLIYDQRKRDELCVSCGKESAELGKLLCVLCIEKQKLHRIKRTSYRQNNGLCYKCGDKIEVGIHCFYHWIVNTCRSNGIPVEHCEDLGIMLIRKQNYKCYYTNKLLVPGENTSIDHMNPLSRGGINELSNYVWCDHIVNQCKRNLTHDEFIELCRNVMQNNCTQTNLFIPINKPQCFWK